MDAPRREPSRVASAVLAGGAVLLALLAFRGALTATFVFDDHLFFSHWCWQIDDASQLFSMFEEPGCRYRPVRYLSLAVDHLIWGPDAFGFHLTNWLLHGLAVYLVYRLLKRAVGDPAAAAVGALLWGVHPVHTDVVTYVAGRRDVLSTVLVLAAYLSWPRDIAGRPARRWLPSMLAAVTLFALALLTKEMAASLPFLLLLAAVFRPALEARCAGKRDLEWPWRRSLRALPRQLLALLSMVLMSAVWFVYRGILRPLTREGVTLWGGDLGHHLMSVLAAYARYLELIVFPSRLYGDYSDFALPADAGDWRVWVGGAFLLLIWGGGLALARRAPHAAFGLLWFGLAMLPVSQIRPHHELLAEHYLYLPLIGLSVPVAYLFSRARRRRRTRLVAVLAVTTAVSLCVLRVDARNREFVSEEAFARAILRHEPDTVRGRLTLAHALQTEGRLDEAIDVLEWVEAHIEPTNRFYPTTLENLLTTHATRGDLSRAEGYAERLLAYDPERAYALRMLGTIRAQEGRLDEALALQQRAFELAPRDVEGRLHLGTTLLRMGRPDEAAPHIEYAVQRWPRDVTARLQWAMVAFMQRDYEAARSRFERVLALDPGNLFALEHLVLVELELGQRDRACRYVEAIGDRRPDLDPADLGCPPAGGAP